VRALDIELRLRGDLVETEYNTNVFYKGNDIGAQRLDMVVDGKVVVEVKSTLDLHPIAKRQLRSYLRSTTFEIGLLLHFGAAPKFYRMVWTSEERRLAATQTTVV